MENSYEFTLKVRPAWDNGKVVEKFAEQTEQDIAEGKEPENIGYDVVFETIPELWSIKIMQPLAPATYSQVLKHMGEKERHLAGDLIISQYMVCGSDDDKAKQERILKDGRLLYSCIDAMSPIFDLCEVELKKG